MRVTGNPGTGAVTVSAAVSGSQSLGAGDDGQVFIVRVYSIDGIGQPGSGLWETQASTWTNSNKTLARSAGGVLDGSSGPGTLVNFSSGTQHALVQTLPDSTLVTDTDGPTVTFDMGVSIMHTVTLGGSRILALAHVNVGQRFLIRLVQGGGGPWTVTWWSGTINWAGGSAPTLTTAAGKTDVFGFIKTNTSVYDAFVIGQNL